jgi:hypothetical protein
MANEDQNNRRMSLIRTSRMFDDADVNTQHIMMMIDKGI